MDIVQIVFEIFYKQIILLDVFGYKDFILNMIIGIEFVNYRQFIYEIVEFDFDIELYD